MAVELSEAIAQIRAELAIAVSNRIEVGPQLLVESVELELELVVESVKKGGGGVKFYVVNVDAAGEHRSSTRNQVRVVLRPQSSDGSPLYTVDSLQQMPD